MLRRHLNQIWDQLRGKKPQLNYFLEEVRIARLRGISDCRVRFTYPVSVLAGPNTCGKSTVLWALACAYKVPGAGVRDFVPSAVFPDFKSTAAELPADEKPGSAFEYYYIHAGQRYQMRWSRGANWNKSFLGLKDGRRPERSVYVRTLANLSSPSEVRSVLQLGRLHLESKEVSADLLTFAHRVLPLRYRQLLLLSHGRKDLLFAARDDAGGPSYSEFHMSAGERAILRLSKDLSGLHDALVLIDEVEAGLHPFIQQQLMLELQRLALRNGLQVVVTTHSPTVLDTVPAEGRLFLERTADNVEVRAPYRDIIQKAFYGCSMDRLSVLCEDEVAEALVRGVLDVLNPRLNLTPSDVDVGRDTGKDEFPQHVRALAKFKQLDDFVFVCDGDARSIEGAARQTAADQGQAIRLLFLPGNEPPEAWVWRKLQAEPAEYASEIGMPGEEFDKLLHDIDRLFQGAADTAANIAKGRLTTFSERLARDAVDLCRMVGRKEAGRPGSDMIGFVEDVEQAIQSWRSARG